MFAGTFPLDVELVVLKLLLGLDIAGTPFRLAHCQ